MALELAKKTERAERRRRRVRGKVMGTPEVPRLTVARTLKHIYVQIVDDVSGTTLIGVASTSKTLAATFGKKDNKTGKAKKMGQAVAELALAKGIKRVVFDRNRFRYHGRVKAVADGAREKGLEF